MSHSLNLAAKHVLKTFAPIHPTPRSREKERDDARASNPAADVDQDDEMDEEDEGELDESKLVDFQPGDLLGKALAFVTQACPHSDGSVLAMVFLTMIRSRYVFLHKHAHSSPSNASQPAWIRLSFSSGAAHGGRPWIT
jgi:hypothetical protein